MFYNLNEWIGVADHAERRLARINQACENLERQARELAEVRLIDCRPMMPAPMGHPVPRTLNPAGVD